MNQAGTGSIRTRSRSSAQDGRSALAFPKPTRAEKTRQPLRAKRWGVSRSKRGTAHSRRVREWGRMAFAHTWDCDVRNTFIELFGGVLDVELIPGPCRGRREYMHLHLEEGSGKRAPDHQGAMGCEAHHGDIDGEIGGRGPWYVALGREGQLRLRRRMVENQRGRWDRLLPSEQIGWDEIAAAGRRAP